MPCQRLPESLAEVFRSHRACEWVIMEALITYSQLPDGPMKNRWTWHWIAFCFGFAAVCCGGIGIASDEEIRYQRDVLPILSNYCFSCHGPDAGSNDSGLRLDLAASAHGDLPSGTGRAVWPGQPERSEILLRIKTDDVDLKMPPPDSYFPPLTAQQVAILEGWIRQGATYEALWSWQPLPPSVAVPQNPEDSWSRNEIDRFVWAELRRRQWLPTEEAARWRWLRRVSLDLTGLPPTVAEVREFAADTAPDAYERVVERLLNSRAFGEHFAVKWLDVARYGDSYGYQSDLLCTVWPYRDWVVRAFNQNLPYDQFLTWQLAGDLLENPTEDQRIATAFNRLHRQTNEGGSIDLEWRTEYAADRVHTFGTAMLGLTLECARCHDHKFDAITQRDYYQLMSFFNNIDEYGLYNNTPWVPTPSMLLPSAAERQRDLQLEQELSAALAEEAAAREGLEDRFKAWLAQLGETADLPSPTPRVLLDFERRTESHQFLATESDQPIARTSAENSSVPGWRGQGLQFSGDHRLEIDAFPFQLNQPFTVAMWIKIPPQLRDAIIWHQQSGTDAGFAGPVLSLRNGKLSFSLVRFWPGNTLAVESAAELVSDQWVHLVAVYDGSLSAAGMKLYIDGQLSTKIVRDRLTKNIPAEAKLHVGERFRSVGLVGGVLDEIKIYDDALTAIEIAAEATRSTIHQRWSAVTERERQAFFAERIDEPLRAARRRASDVRWRRILNNDPMVELMIMEELPGETPTYILERGAYDAPRTPERLVRRDTIASLTPFPAEAPRDRLGLARWVTDPDHPLTARVAVNRFWENFFGRGLVETLGDFGVQGARPSHPELLDWLARDFVTHGWDVKRLCRQIVLSATYRQDSRCSAELKELDPDNRWLARGPSVRLSAEQLRDSALLASGLLKEMQGGPPVRPYQPGDLWRENNTMSPGFTPSQGDDLFRRSLYSVWKRTAPLPNMIALDAAGRETCTAARTQTNTPIQALVMLNDPQFVEAANHLALRAAESLKSEVDPAQVVNEMSLAICSREASDEERRILVSLWREQRKMFAREPEAARQLLLVGSGLIPLETMASEPQTDLAAWSVVALALLNSDAALMKR